MEIINDYIRSIIINDVDLGLTPPVKTIIGTYVGLNFDTNAKSVFLKQKIPKDWNNNSDLILRVFFASQDGDSISDGETVKFDISYRSSGRNESIQNGVVVNKTNTYIQDNGSINSGLFSLDLVIDYNNNDQPISIGNILGIKFNRDVVTDTYSGGIIVLWWELVLESNLLPFF